MKTKSKDQLTLSFDGEPAPAVPPEKLEWRQGMIEQIRRDMQAYREENESPWWKEFYRERIEAYRASVLKFDKEGGV